MSDTYTVKQGRKSVQVEARQYTRDQDWDLVNWIGRAQVFRDHFKVFVLEGSTDSVFASKGDWIVKYPDHVEVQTNRVFTAQATKTKEEE